MKRRFWMTAMLASVLVVSTAVVACGGDEDDDDGDVTPAVSTQPASATEPASEATEPTGDATEPPDEGVVSLTAAAQDFSFTVEPSSVSAESVVKVAFTNNGAAPHTFTAYTDAEYSEAIPAGDSGQVAGGQSVNFTFEAPEDGSVFYRCEVHPAQMQGELTVE